MESFSLLIKPAGPDCNLDCRYCFYSHKGHLFGEEPHRMNNETLQKLIKDYLALRLPLSSFVWQGGEPTLMGLDFYRSVVQLQQQHSRNGQIIRNALQTNGTLIDDKWCEFLSKYKFLIGISLDGPKNYHDCYRLSKTGKGTFERVVAAVENCRKHKVEFNILVLLNDRNVIAPDELLDFFIAKKIKYLQFIPCIEKDSATGKIADFSITPKQYGDFLCRIFDRWYDYGTDKVSISIIDSILNYLTRGAHSNCTFSRKCSHYIVIEHNGDAFCCDFFVDKQYHLGNIFEMPVEKLFKSDKQQQFARQKSNIHNKCLVCRHNPICRGGCLKDRIIFNSGFANPSFFCQAYKQFFEYSVPRLSQSAAKIVN